MSRRSVIPEILALLVLLAGVQLLATLTGREYYLTQFTMSAYYCVVILGLCLVMGYGGQISLGHGAFFAIGGYTSAVMTTQAQGIWATFMGKLTPSGLGGLLGRIGVLVQRQDLYGDEFLCFTPWAAFCTAIILTAVIATVVGYPALRLKGHYLAMATLGFGLIVYRFLLGSEFTGGADGVVSVPPWHVLPGLDICGKRGWRLPNFYASWGLTAAVLAFLLNVVRSRTGRALRSIHDGELAANAMGINTAGYKLKVFVISACLAATAGSFLTHFTGGIGPAEAGVMKSVRYVALVAAGGMANVWGVLVVGFVLTFLSLRGAFDFDAFGHALYLDHAVFGGILIAIMSLAPDGPLKPIGALLGRGWRRLRGRGRPGLSRT